MIYLIIEPILNIPMITCSKPANIKQATIGPMTVCTLPVTAIKEATVAAVITVMGPVGPLICEGVPPNTAAKNPRKIAPYNPAAAPRPDCRPNASASGRATIPAVNPPKKSPFVILKFFILLIIGNATVASNRLLDLVCKIFLKRNSATSKMT